MKKRLIKIFALLCLCAVFSVSLAAFFLLTRPPRQSFAVSVPERGLFVYTLSGRDFPLRPGASPGELDSQIAGIARNADAGGYDAIFFEVRPAGDSFYSSKAFPRSAFWLGRQDKLTTADPLKSLIKEADKYGIAVYAVINPYYLGSVNAELSKKSPAVKYAQDCFESGALRFFKPESERAKSLNISDVTRLLDKYSIAGVVLHETERPELVSREDYSSHFNSLVDSLAAAASDRGKLLGVVVGQSAEQSPLKPTSTAADFVIPTLSGTPDSGLESDIAGWSAALGADNVLPLMLPSGEHTPEHSDNSRLINQLYLASRSGVSRYCVAGLRSSAIDRTIPLLPGAMLNIETLLSTLSLDYERSLGVTRPAQPIRVTAGTYYILGTSDPGQPLYMDGEEIERNTTTGLFGKLVRLDMGDNRFEFTQGDTASTAVITRYTSSGPSRVTSLSSMHPANFAFARQGGVVTLTCTGPSGGNISVSVGGVTANMRQRSSAADGAAVTYEAGIVLPGALYIPGEVTAAGPVSYTLTYNGQVTRYTSSGEVYAVAQGVTPAVRVTSQNTSVYIDPSRDGVFTGQLKPGTLDFVVGESNNYVELMSGGFIRKECCEPLADPREVIREAGAVTSLNHTRDDLLFIGGAGGVPFLIEQDESGVLVTLYNLQGFPGEVESFSELFERCEVSQERGRVTLRLSYAGTERPWGTDVFYEEDNAVVAVRRKPALTGTPEHPLKGLVVLLDPGHGGTDPGALGVAGEGGPNEIELNMAVSLVTKARLEALGATVHLTHDGNDSVPMVERMQTAQDIRPDFFISLHHNSVAESTDAGRAGGVECYYHFDNARALAQKLVENVSDASGRYRRGAFSSYYVVTKMSGFPSVLLELGFVSNPLEYERMLDPYDIFKTAGAISQAIYELSA